MPNVFRTVLKMYNLAPGDFPDIQHFQSISAEQDFSKFPSLKQGMIDNIESVLTNDIPRLMDALPRSLDPDSRAVAIAPHHHGDSTMLKDTSAPAPPMLSQASAPPIPAATAVAVADNPFDNPFDDDEQPTAWALDEYIPMYQEAFNKNQQGGFVSGGAAKNVLLASGLNKNVLRTIWDLADHDKDGKLSLHEFVIAMVLADVAKEGNPLPATLDPSMAPPKK
jgi:hypothetical protein